MVQVRFGRVKVRNAEDLGHVVGVASSDHIAEVVV